MPPLPMITSPIPGYASVSLSKTLQIIYSRGTDWGNQCQQCPLPFTTRFRMERSIIKGNIASKIIGSIIETLEDYASNKTSSNLSFYGPIQLILTRSKTIGRQLRYTTYTFHIKMGSHHIVSFCWQLVLVEVHMKHIEHKCLHKSKSYTVVPLRVSINLLELHVVYNFSSWL